MYHRFSSEELFRLLDLAGRVGNDRRCDISAAVRWIEKTIDARADAEEDAAPRPRPRRALHEYAQGIRQIRMRRHALLGEFDFRDPGWDMLLDLYIGHCRGEQVFVGTLCHGAGVPYTTALRHLDRLERGGLIRRCDDQSDSRRILVHIAKSTVEALEDVLGRLQRCA